VGRFDPHTRVQAGEDVEMAVDTRALHFFDVATGLGIYGEQAPREQPAAERRHQVAA
jgi:hypothetical protein